MSDLQESVFGWYLCFSNDALLLTDSKERKNSFHEKFAECEIIEFEEKDTSYGDACKFITKNLPQCLLLKLDIPYSHYHQSYLPKQSIIYQKNDR